MDSNSKAIALKAITIVYFSMTFFEIGSEFYDFAPLTLISRIAIPVLLSLLYFIKSEKRDLLYFAIMLPLMVSNASFYFKSPNTLYISVFASMLFKTLTLVLAFKLIRKKNYLYILMATFPFLLIFFYLMSVTNEVPNYEFNILILQSILISILGGLATTSYLQNDNRHNSWLLISTLLFIGLRFIVFIESYFLADINIYIYRPMEVILNIFAFFTFYKFVTTAEIDNTEIKQ